jgi:hypothetical protein
MLMFINVQLGQQTTVRSLLNVNDFSNQVNSPTQCDVLIRRVIDRNLFIKDALLIQILIPTQYNYLRQ